MIVPGIIYILTGPRITGISADLLETRREIIGEFRALRSVRKSSITNPDTMKHASLTPTLTLKEITRHISTALPSPRLYFRATRDTRTQSRFTVINRQTVFRGV